jgi:hypothetical protein
LLYVIKRLSSQGKVEAQWDLEEVIPQSANLEYGLEKHVEYKVDGRDVRSSAVTTHTITMGRE